MNTSEERDLIRRYLLRELPDDELKQLEERLITDHTFFNRILAEEEAMIDQYVSERMPPQCKERFEVSYMSTPEGLEQVNLAKGLTERAAVVPLKKTTPSSETPGDSFFARGLSNQFLKVAASITILCGLSLVIWLVFFYQSDLEAGMTALNQAYSRQRTVEVRPTDMNYAPLASTRGGRDDVDDLSLSRAKNYLRSAVSDKPDAESHQAWGRLHLMRRDFDKAIEEFKIALDHSEGHSKIHSDLGAALLERAKAKVKSGAGDGKVDMLESLKHLNRAIELDNSLAEAFFNRGLLHREMGEPGLAITDWNKYLELDKDPESRWSGEVRNMIKSLTQ